MTTELPNTAEATRRDGSPLTEGLGAWQPIATVPHDTTVLLANFAAKCLLTGAPHVWTATYVTKWQTLDGGSVDGQPMWCECSYAATNENGEPTHWMLLPAAPEAPNVGGEARLAAHQPLQTTTATPQGVALTD